MRCVQVQYKYVRYEQEINNVDVSRCSPWINDDGRSQCFILRWTQLRCHSEEEGITNNVKLIFSGTPGEKSKCWSVCIECICK